MWHKVQGYGCKAGIMMIVSCCFVPLLVTALSCQAENNGTTTGVLEKFEPEWKGEVVKIPTTFRKDSLNRFEFSADGNMICLFCYPDYFNVFPRKVYDLKGNEIKNALDPNGSFLSEYFHLFYWAIPKSADNYAAHQFHTYKRTVGRLLLKDTPCPDLLMKTNSWCLSDDLSKAICLMSPASQERESKRIELWTLRPEKKMKWSLTLARGMNTWRKAGFFELDGKQYVMISSLFEMFIISCESGAIIGKINYGDNYISEADIEPGQQLCAVSGFGTTRIFSLKPPYMCLYELGMQDDPNYKSLTWMTERVKFAGGHYVIVAYDHSDRLGGPEKYYRPTDIFDLWTGKRVWRENSESITDVLLSPDGKKLAYIRDYETLEIGDFVPEPASGQAKPNGQAIKNL